MGRVHTKATPNTKITRLIAGRITMWSTTHACDELNLDKYLKVKKLKDFKEKMMMILYIITNEGKGEWFTVADVLCLVTDIFGEAATKDQVNEHPTNPWEYNNDDIICMEEYA